MHEVEALIAEGDRLTGSVRQFKNAVICPLIQGFALLPITETFAGELVASWPQAKVPLMKPLESVSEPLLLLAADISRNVPVAYVNTYYFGGLCGQDALVWDKGSLRFSPATQDYKQVWPNSPISQALRMIGVVAEAGMDEFDTVGLGTHRRTDRWAQSVK
jgi:hypothetical protein